ncbi:MAG: SUMF1/EgtB/PvdO family nonheme iron enzyme [Verrucomicrobiota bacterium]
MDFLAAQRIDGIHVEIDHRLDATKAWCASESLTASTRDRLLHLAPIFCTSAEAQSAYPEALDRYLRLGHRGTEPTAPGPTPPAAEDTRPRRPFPWGLVALVVVGLILLWRAWPTTPSPLMDRRIPQPSTNPPVVLELRANATFAVATNVFPTEPSPTSPTGPGTAPAALRILSRFVAVVATMALLAAIWDRLRRRLYLQQGPSQQEALQRLQDPGHDGAPRHDASLAPAAVAMARRMTGHRSVLHPASTIRATIRNGGAFSPRFQSVVVTPAYLVLVEEAHERDHFATYLRDCLARLAMAGVALEVWTFRGSPDTGCARRDPLRPAPSGRAAVTLPDLLGSFPAHRIVVVADPRAGIHPSHGRPRAWMRRLADRPERGWITPAAAGRSDRLAAALHAHGFRVLPPQPDAFLRFAAWLAKGAPMDQDAAQPAPRVPSLLADDPLRWLASAAAPSRGVRAALVTQLQATLSPKAFQLLCATAVFPALAPGLTRELAARMPGDVRPSFPDLFHVASLPFHRHAHLPDWLRGRLLRSMEPAIARDLRNDLNQRLANMLLHPAGEGIPVHAPGPARSLAALWAWLRSARGMAGDSVMVAFLNPGHLNPLAQRLPEPLRERLFQNGVAAHGLRAWAMAALVALAAVAWATPVLYGWMGSGTEQGSTPFTLARPSLTLPAFTNSLGMVFVPVANAGVWFSAYETRVQDYEAFAKTRTGGDASWRNPIFQGIAVTPGPTHPVVNVSWNDARDFCQWLTATERRAGTLPANRRYRLPTDLEWSAAVGLPREQGATPKERDSKIPDVYPWGTQWPPPRGAGNFADVTSRDRLGITSGFIQGYDDGFATTSPVGSFPATRIGIHDLAGNVWEWCEDWYDTDQKFRVLRGGSWYVGDPRDLLSSFRVGDEPDERGVNVGFRVVLGVDEPAR